MMILNKGLEQGSICLSGFGILEILGENILIIKIKWGIIITA